MIEDEETGGEFELDDEIDNEEVALVDNDDGSVDVPLSRKEKKQARKAKYEDMQRELAEMKRVQAESSARQASFERDAIDEAAQLRAERSPNARKSPLDQLEEQRERLSTQWASMSAEQRADEKTQQEYKRAGIENERARIRLAAEQVVAEKQTNTAAEAQRQMIRAEFPDVVDDDKTRMWAQGYFQQQRATRKDVTDIELTRESFGAAREQFKTRGRKGPGRKPSEEERGRYSGEGKGAGGGGSDRKSFRMTTEFRDMADHMWPDMPEAQRYQKWAREVGSKLKD